MTLHIVTADGRFPVRRVEIVFAELEQRMRAGIVRTQLVESEWPAAILHPIAFFEVPRVERTAPAAPAIAAAAKKAAAAAVGIRIRNTYVLAAIQIARGVVRLVPTAFQQDGIDALLIQLERKRDPRDPCPDDADGRLHYRVLLYIPAVNEHPRAPSRVQRFAKSSCRLIRCRHPL